MYTLADAIRAQGDRFVAIALVVMVTVGLAGIVSAETGASFTSSSTNPNNTVAAMLVQPPASQGAPTSGAGGVVNLSWAATPTAPGAGHTLTYLVLRGPVGGPYTQITSVSTLAYTDTPPSDGTYQYAIQARVTAGGSFTSGNSTARNGISDRVGPTVSVGCNGAACSSAAWYTAAVSVTVTATDSGSGMGSVTRDVDGAGQVSTAGASATFSVSGDGANHSVLYFGTDAVGNTSGSSTQALKIDGTPPPAATLSGLRSGTLQGDVTLTWTQAADATSGVATFDVYRKNVSGSGAACGTTGFTAARTGLASGVTNTVVNVGNNQWACFYLITKDNAGNQTQSNIVKAQGL